MYGVFNRAIKMDVLSEGLDPNPIRLLLAQGIPSNKSEEALFL